MTSIYAKNESVDVFGLAKILDTFLSHLHTNQQRKLTELHREAEHASMNQGAGAQLDAQGKTLSSTEIALNRITQRDRDTITRIILKELQDQGVVNGAIGG